MLLELNCSKGKEKKIKIKERKARQEEEKQDKKKYYRLYFMRKKKSATQDFTPKRGLPKHKFV